MPDDRFDIELIDGVDWTPSFTPKDEDGAVVDPTTYTPMLTIKDRFGGSVVRALTRDNGITTDYVNGGEFPHLAGDDIATLPQRGAFYFHTTTSDGVTRELTYGYVVRSVR